MHFVSIVIIGAQLTVVVMCLDHIGVNLLFSRMLVYFSIPT